MTQIDEKVLRAQLAKTLDATNLPELGEKYEGKVRDCYVRDGKRTLIATDRISAFDVVLGTIPFKGQVLNQMAAFWFEATADLVAQPRHQRPRSRGDGGARVQAAAGRADHARLHDGRDLDVDLDRTTRRARAASAATRCPTGCRRTSSSPRPILTPSTKADEGRSRRARSRATRSWQMGQLSAEDFDAAAEMCARVFAFGQAEVAAPRASSWSTPSTRSAAAPTARLVLHRRDPHPRLVALLVRRRLRRALRPGRGAARPRQGVRPPRAGRPGVPRRGAAAELSDDLRVEAARRYIQVCELVTGRPFVPDTDEPLARIRRNLKLGA